jgi:hypothetical protein
MGYLYDDQNIVSVRFYSAYSQRVKIKLYNAQFREIAVLYENPVYAEAQNLLRLKESLPSGKYILVATTDNKRYVESFIVK